MTNWLMPGDKCITRNKWAEYLTPIHTMDIVLGKMDLRSKLVYSMKGIHCIGFAGNGGKNIV
eukprot:913788-Ditylum_brightwellii.AAC.1